MAIEVILPKVDMDMTSGRITKWFAQEGASVTTGEPLFEIETDKAAMEIEAPATGTLAHVVGEPDIDIAVGIPVAWIFADGEPVGDTPPQAMVPSGAPNPQKEPLEAEPTGADLLPAPAPSVVTGAAGKPRATPLARRLTRNAGISLTQISGSGPRGRITRADVDQWIARAPVTPEDAGPLAGLEDGDYKLVPHSAMRRTIARRLVASIQTVPHFFLTTDCDIDALQKIRAELNASAPRTTTGDAATPDWKITVNDLVVKALAAALHAVPEANVTWTDAAMVHHTHVDVAVATDIPGGLVTPVVRQAETRSLSAISNQIRDLVARARDGRLDRDEYQGGTTNVSNLGMFGVSQFDAIINPPQSTSLAIGRGERRPIFAEDGVTVVGKTLMTVTLSADHRAIDGALAARVLSTFKEIIENPLLLIV